MKADKTKKDNRPKRVTLNAKLLTVQLGSLCMALLVFFVNRIELRINPAQRKPEEILSGIEK